MTLKYTTQTIHIATPSGKVPVPARVAGVFGYSKVFAHHYQVTHIPTGHGLSTFFSVAQAQQFIDVCRVSPHDWTQTDIAYFSRPEVLEWTKELKAQAIAIRTEAR